MKQISEKELVKSLKKLRVIRLTKQQLIYIKQRVYGNITKKPI